MASNPLCCPFNGITRLTRIARRALGVWLLVIGASGACTNTSAADEGPKPRLTLKSKTVLDATSPLAGTCYSRLTGVEMIGPRGYSPDNGRTWMPLTPTPDFDSGLPYGYRRGSAPPWLDPVNGNILRVLNCMDTPGLDPKAHEPSWQWKSYYLRYRVSADGGKTYLLDEPIVQEGDYTPEQPIAGVWRGRNSLMLGDVGNRPIRTRAGSILVPVQMWPLDEQGEFFNPGGGWYWLDTVILIGRWTEKNHLRWDVSEPIRGDGQRTIRGLYEGTLAELADGRILCVMRGCNGSKGELPSRKWYAISEDGGKRWSRPQPWEYTDGSLFYSPSSMSQLLTCADGRIFWLGNLSQENCRANHPRWPLVIGQVDSRTGMLVKDSVLEVDTKQPDEPDVNLSHWLAYEDRETGDIVIPMSRASAGYKSYQPVLYVIGVQ